MFVLEVEENISVLQKVSIRCSDLVLLRYFPNLLQTRREDGYRNGNTQRIFARSTQSAFG